MTIGNRVREIRNGQKLSMKDFGKRIGISDSAVSQIENGKTGISDQTIRSICREFGASEIYLRTGAGDPYDVSEKEREMSDFIKSLFPERKDDFRSALMTALLRFDPEGPEWAILEKILAEIIKEIPNNKESGD